MNVDLPTPGTPLIPMRCSAAAVPVSGQQVGEQLAGPAAWWSSRRDSTSVMARAIEARRPSRTPSASSSVALTGLFSGRLDYLTRRGGASRRAAGHGTMPG